MTPAHFLAELAARRISLVPTADSWTLRGPPGTVSNLAEPEKAALREALTGRRMAMLAQVPETGPLLPLHARPGPFPADCCWSCGEELNQGEPQGWRCALCSEAARAAVAQVRAGRESGRAADA